MPVSKTPILTSSPRKPWFHSVSAENMETTLERSAISFLLPPLCSLPSSCSPWEGRVENLHTYCKAWLAAVTTDNAYGATSNVQQQ